MDNWKNIIVDMYVKFSTDSFHILLKKFMD